MLEVRKYCRVSLFCLIFLFVILNSLEYVFPHFFYGGKLVINTNSTPIKTNNSKFPIYISFSLCTLNIGCDEIDCKISQCSALQLGRIRRLYLKILN